MSKPSVRVAPYTTLELNTLWKHFSVDSLITKRELGGLIERIVLKDAKDIFEQLKLEGPWDEFCSSIMKELDPSAGKTLDLNEFRIKFNVYYTNRFYYLMRFLFQHVHKVFSNSNTLAESAFVVVLGAALNFNSSHMRSNAAFFSCSRVSSEDFSDKACCKFWHLNDRTSDEI